MLSTQQMLNHDYDWFCIINDFPVCVASNGDIIPDVVNFGNNVINTQKRAYRLPRTKKFQINTNYIEGHIVNTGFDYLLDDNSPYKEILRPKNITFPQNTPPAVQYYSEYFAKMAERGFYVFDRPQESEDLYSLVAWPTSFNMDILFQHIYKEESRIELQLPQLDFYRPQNLTEIYLVDLVNGIFN